MLLAGDCNFDPGPDGKTCKCGHPLEQHRLWERRFGAGIARSASSEKQAAPPKAWDRQTRISGPHGWIQWKGTQVCMDIHCSCGFWGHVDREFFYFWRCPNPDCGKVWMVNGHVEFVEVFQDELEKMSSDQIADLDDWEKDENGKNAKDESNH
jgi:hypothetical protein